MWRQVGDERRAVRRATARPLCHRCRSLLVPRECCRRAGAEVWPRPRSLHHVRSTFKFAACSSLSPSSSKLPDLVHALLEADEQLPVRADASEKSHMRAASATRQVRRDASASWRGATIASSRAPRVVAGAASTLLATSRDEKPRASDEVRAFRASSAHERRSSGRRDSVAPARSSPWSCVAEHGVGRAWHCATTDR